MYYDVSRTMRIIAILVICLKFSIIFYIYYIYIIIYI